MKKLTLPLVLTLFTLLVISCSVATPNAPAVEPAGSPQPKSLTLVTHDSFDISEDVLQQFMQETGIEVEILKGGDAGEMLNTLILSKENPLGDVVFGIDNTFLSRALDADLFLPYESPLLEDIPDALEMDMSHRLLPVDSGYVTLNYDVAWFAENGLEPPIDFKDLIEPAYKDLTVVENPASSSPGLAFLLATIGRFGIQGDHTYEDYWRDLKANGVLVADGWNEAYWGAFTVGSGGEGDRPIVVSYATSPVAEVYFNELEAPPTRSVNTPGNSFTQIEFVGILRGTGKEDTARLLVDFLLDQTFQEDIPLHMFVYPANTKADAGELFAQWAEMPRDPVTVDPAQIAAHREAWIETWTDIMLR